MKKFIIILFLITLQFANAKDDTILFLGDSLTEGLGVTKDEAFPKLVKILIQKELKKDISIINAGVSGSTTSDGLDRLKWYLKKKPSIVFLALGTNDGLRGLDLKQSQKNLEEIIKYAQESGAKVLLAGMLIPPNYGPEYSENFRKMYEEIKDKYKLKSMPFLLDQVAGNKNLNQSDGIHPNEQGHKTIAKNVFEFIKEDL
ncbi:putative lysophospholipase L1-like arylesterase [Arcobacter acticola]|jgi:acyl-CoA thioesterase-1|uniref:Putative lysophospholipase L1-like arylesterase n=1 Tax=Arcobacter acticola TaxID=1849015 RepID=A0A6M8EJV6_9BACT|nr:arylesterase [Arcobacter acticola]QKE28768.1 putative lysophospholipase L1-like arylesterase [Arcobacter acticola]